MVLDFLYWTKSPIEILLVSKAVNAKVQGFLRHENTFNLRVCWRDVTFDGLVILCFQARVKRLDYDRISHLRIEMYPSHQDRFIDMVRIWRHVYRLCYDL